MEVVRVSAEESVVRALEIDPGEIEPRAAGQRQAIGRVERVEPVDAEIGVVRPDVDRVEEAVGLVDDERGGGQRVRVVGETDRAELAPADVMRPAVVERRADG